MPICEREEGKSSAKERGGDQRREGDAPAEESHDSSTGQHAAECVEDVSVRGVDHLLVEDELRRKTGERSVQKP